MTDGPPAGWYPDDTMEATQRYWDGAAWTEHRAPLAVKPAGGGSEGLVTAGWVCAVLIPIVGLVIGAILASERNDQGWWIVFTSLAVSAFVAFALL